MYKNEVKDDKDRLFQTGRNNEGELMMIVEYRHYDDIIVRFEDANLARVHTQYANFLKGSVRNPKKPTHGYHGYMGQGKYQSEYKIDGKRVKEPAYEIWRHMHERAGDFKGDHPAYLDVKVSEEWWDFQNFAQWYHDNMYKVDDEVMCLDKDIKFPGNRIYGPSECLIVPNRINEIFKRGDKKKDSDSNLPTGVTIRTDGNKIRYRARCSIRVGYRQYKTISKTFKTVDEAYECYKEMKIKYIQDVAEEYKDKLPKHVYKALMEYYIPESI